MTKIIQRHDTAANWTTVNPVLAAGEMGVETDTSKFKFGNGTSTWSELAYATSGSASTGGGTQLTSSDGATSYSTLALGDNLVVDYKDIASWTNPTMTSNSQNGYVLSASCTQASEIYMAFNRDTTTGDNAWYSGGVGFPQWIMMECPEAVRLTSCTIMNEIKTAENFKNAYIQGSNDGSSFDTLYTITNRPDRSGYSEIYNFTNNNYYKYLRLYFTSGWTSGVSLQNVEFSGFVKNTSAVPSLNVNLDELGNEVNTLANTKQDKLTAKAPLKIATEEYKELNITVNTDGGLDKNFVYSIPESAKNTNYGDLLSTDYTLPLSTADSWEIVLKTSYTSLGDTIRVIHVGDLGLYTTLPTKNEILYVNAVTSPNNNKVLSSSLLAQGNVVWLKMEFTGSAYIVSVSNNGADYIVLNSTNSKVRSSNGNIRIGYNQNSTRGYRGAFYLTDSYYKINGVKYPLAIIKEGTLVISSGIATTSSLGVVQPDGTSITVSETGIISGQDVKTFTGYSDTGTLVLKSINGVLQWVTE